MLEVEHLRFSFGAREVLRGVDLRAEPGELVFVLGANGAGKTTLVKHFNGILRPTSGQVLINGEDINSRATARAMIHDMDLSFARAWRIPPTAMMGA